MLQPDYLRHIQSLRDLWSSLTRADARKASLEEAWRAFENCRLRMEAALTSLHGYDPKLADHIRNKEIR